MGFGGAPHAPALRRSSSRTPIAAFRRTVLAPLPARPRCGLAPGQSSAKSPRAESFGAVGRCSCTLPPSASRTQLVLAAFLLLPVSGRTLFSGCVRGRDLCFTSTSRGCRAAIPCRIPLPVIQLPLFKEF